MKKLSIFFMVGALSGCGQSDIEFVRTSYADSARTVSFSQLLDNRELCQNTRWEEFENERKQKIVSYTCTFNNSYDYLSSERDKFLSQGRNEFESMRDRLVEDIDKFKRIISDGYTEENNRVNTLRAEYETALGLNSTRNPYIDQLTSIKDQLKEINISKDKIKFLDLLTSDEVEDIPNLYWDLGSLRAQYSFYKKDLENGEGERRAMIIDQYHARYVRDFDRLIQDVESLVQGEQAKLEREKQNKAENTKYQLGFAEMGLEGAQKTIPDELDKAQKKLDEVTALYTPENLQEAALKNHPLYKSVGEEFNWAVNKDGEASLIFGRTFSITEDGEKNNVITYPKPYDSLVLLSRFNQGGFRDYINMQFGGNMINFLRN